MRANESVPRNLLQGDKCYVVPLYQRTYSWTRDNLAQLWADIVMLLDAPNEDGHFLGSVVLAPSHANTASGVQSWLVVDGQQRITTLSILLCAIRDLVKGENPQLARKIDVQYLLNEFANGSERYTLLPTQADRNSWTDLVDGKAVAGGEDTIGSSYRFFLGQLEQLVREGDEVRYDKLQRLEQVVVSKLSFVEISAQAGDNVYRIFESLNNTGLKLTQADLLRNYLFMRLPKNSERIYATYWLPMQNLLKDDLVDLIWLDLVLKGSRAVRRSLYQEQQKHLERLATEAQVEEWIVELHAKASVFRLVLAPTEEENPQVREALDRLHRWGATVVHPIALRVMLSYRAGQLDAQQVADALRVVESYLVRQALVGMASAGNNVMLGDLVKAFDDEVPTAKAITRVLTRQRSRFPGDQAVREAVLEHPFYWRGKEWQKKFVLRCFEEGWGRGEQVDFEKSKLTIEHVMPQTLTEEWRRGLAQDLGDYETVEELHQAVVHTLGNLTLSAYNGQMSNKPFDAKRRVLASSGLAMNLDIAERSTWGVAEIRQRGEELADLAIKIWPGPDDSIPHEPQSPKLAAVRRALREVPSGRWTNYLTIAQVSGTHRRTISKWLVQYALPNAHRVLKSDGAIPATISMGCHSREEQIAVLEAEGIAFGKNSRAGMKHHLSLEDLVKLLEGDNGVEGEER
ncbi:GmrSD restriction endonuclease domain-containing protein [Actinosynnema pretiosum]|uniref:DUF262 domain-containing protein n=1 Tax=Actinosynnema pretiosum TaxID=42197 RepID=A0A290Z215_9PSEU|nr:DUF262 domain-containing protein [Actinosynnema pretiosum]ATE52993.1 hypothetical protein CNX65_06615 [Actinosynnema pretiosum]